MAFTIAELFVKLGLSSASLDAGLEKSKLKVRQTAQEIKGTLTKETKDARNAVDLLGRGFGVSLPRELKTFLSQLPGVKTLLAGAFQATVVTGVTVAVGAGVLALRDWFNEWRTGNAAFAAGIKNIAEARLEINKLNEAQLMNLRTQLRVAQATAEARITRLTAPGEILSGDVFGRVDAEALAAATKEMDRARTGLLSINDALAALRDKAEKPVKPAAIEGIHKAAKQAVTSVRELAASLDGLTDKNGQPFVMQFTRPDFLQQTASEWLDSWNQMLGAVKPVTTELEKVHTGMTDMQQAAVQFQSAIGQAFEDAIVNGESLRNVFRALLQDIGRMILRTFVLNRLFGFIGNLFGGMGGGGGGWASNLLGGGGGGVWALPANATERGYAAGGFMPPHSWGIVGERGPELALAGAHGATIMPLGAGGKGDTIVVNMNGVSSTDRLEQLRFAAQIAETISEVKIRRVQDRARRTP
jgi:hypothetical protein